MGTGWGDGGRSRERTTGRWGDGGGREGTTGYTPENHGTPIRMSLGTILMNHGTLCMGTTLSALCYSIPLIMIFFLPTVRPAVRGSQRGLPVVRGTQRCLAGDGGHVRVVHGGRRDGRGGGEGRLERLCMRRKHLRGRRSVKAGNSRKIFPRRHSSHRQHRVAAVEGVSARKDFTHQSFQTTIRRNAFVVQQPYLKDKAKSLDVPRN